MAIKNTLLGGTDWTAGDLYVQDLNDTFSASISRATESLFMGGVARVAAANRTDEHPLLTGIYADRVREGDGGSNGTSSDVLPGHHESIIWASSSACVSGKMITPRGTYPSGHTNHTETDISGGAWSDVDSAFDGDHLTFAKHTAPGANTVYTASVGKTFPSAYVGTVYVSGSGVESSGGTFTSWQVSLQTYDGSTWTNVRGIASSTATTGAKGLAFTDHVVVNSTVQGVRVRFNSITTTSSGTLDLHVYRLDFGTELQSTARFHGFEGAPTRTMVGGPGVSLSGVEFRTVPYSLPSSLTPVGVITPSQIDNLTKGTRLEPVALALVPSDRRGYTFPSTFITRVRIVGTTTGSAATRLQTYNGSTWDTHPTIIGSRQSRGQGRDTFAVDINIGSSIQGVALYGNANLYRLIAMTEGAATSWRAINTLHPPGSFSSGLTTYEVRFPTTSSQVGTKQLHGIFSA